MHGAWQVVLEAPGVVAVLAIGPTARCCPRQGSRGLLLDRLVEGVHVELCGQHLERRLLDVPWGCWMFLEVVGCYLGWLEVT